MAFPMTPVPIQPTLVLEGETIADELRCRFPHDEVGSRALEANEGLLILDSTRIDSMSKK